MKTVCSLLCALLSLASALHAADDDYTIGKTTQGVEYEIKSKHRSPTWQVARLFHTDDLVNWNCAESNSYLRASTCCGYSSDNAELFAVTLQYAD